MPVVGWKPYCQKGRGGRIRNPDGTRGGRMLCNNRSCPWCWRYLAARKALVLSYIARVAPHSAWVTLSRAPATNSARHVAMKRLCRALSRRCGQKVQMGWVTEVGELGGFHIHAIFHGAPLDGWTIEEIWGSDVRVVPVTYDLGAYMLKAALPPSHDFDESGWERRRARHYDINSNMDFRQTRGFYLEYKTFPEAYRAARQATPAPPLELTVLD